MYFLFVMIRHPKQRDWKDCHHHPLPSVFEPWTLNLEPWTLNLELWTPTRTPNVATNLIWHQFVSPPWVGKNTKNTARKSKKLITSWLSGWIISPSGTAISWYHYGAGRAIMRQSYGSATANIRRCYGKRTAVLRKTYGNHTALLRQTYGSATEIIRQSYGGATAIVRRWQGKLRRSYGARRENDRYDCALKLQ